MSIIPPTSEWFYFSQVVVVFFYLVYVIIRECRRELQNRDYMDKTEKAHDLKWEGDERERAQRAAEEAKRAPCSSRRVYQTMYLESALERTDAAMRAHKPLGMPTNALPLHRAICVERSDL